MGDDKVQELLLKLIEDMSYVKAKLDNIDSQKLNNRIDALEAKAREQDRVVKQLETKSNATDQYIRDRLTDSNKSNKALWTSIGLAIFSVLLNVLVNLL